MKFCVPIVYRGLSNYIVEADSAEQAKEEARKRFEGGDIAEMLGNEWEEIDTIKEPEEFKMKNYVVAVLLTIPADSYEEAQKVGESIADNLASDGGIGVNLVTDYEHDNEGQRVLYLHGEDKPED